ncbi:MAG: sulfatase-like hydrolase/transferase, partial [Planctomycetota bacterium]
MPAPYNVVLLQFDDAGIEVFDSYDVQNKQLGINTNPLKPWSYPDFTNINAELARGVMFSDAYCAPVCSPTRVQLETGRYPFRNGFGWIIRNSERNLSGFREVGDHTSRTDEPFLAEACRRAGIKTIKLGKGHLHEYLSNEGRGGEGMKALGWDIFRGTIQNINQDPDIEGLRDGFARGYWNYRWYRSDDQGGSIEQIAGEYVGRRQYAEAHDLLLGRELEDPFLLLLTCQAPHKPLGSPFDPIDSGCFPSLRNKDTNKVTHSGFRTYPMAKATNPWVSYRASLEAADVEFGNFIQNLKRTGTYDNTVFIMMGDNGATSEILRDARDFGEDLQDPIDTLATTGRMKGSIFRQGTRFPLIISGPPDLLGGTLGRTCGSRVHIVDVYSLVLSLLGAETQASEMLGARTTDGVNLTPLLQDEANEAAWARDHIYVESFRPNGDPRRLRLGEIDPSGRAHRWDRSYQKEINGTWYSYLSFLSGDELVFDLDADPGELNPLSPT